MRLIKLVIIVSFIVSFVPAAIFFDSSCVKTWLVAVQFISLVIFGCAMFSLIKWG